MFPIVDQILGYGATGAFMLFTLWAVVQAGRWGFSRDSKRPGLITLKVEASIEKDRKMGEFLDTLGEREIKQQELCARHNEGLVQIATNLSEHDRLTAALSGDVRQFKLAAIQYFRMTREVAGKVLPDAADDISRHCDEIERIISSREKS